MLKTTLILTALQICVLAAIAQCTAAGGGAYWVPSVPASGVTTVAARVQGTVPVNIFTQGPLAAGRPIYSTDNNDLYNGFYHRAVSIARGAGLRTGAYTSIKFGQALPKTMIHFRVGDLRGDGTNKVTQTIHGYNNGVEVSASFEEFLNGAYITAGNTINGGATTTNLVQSSVRIFFDAPVDSVVVARVSFGDYVVISVFSTCQILLPFKLAGFQAKINNGSTVLNWITTDAYNFSQFMIERSTDGSNWTDIGSRKIDEYSFAKNHFIFSDEKPQAGKNFYRLKTIDFDGSENYSETTSVNFMLSSGDLLQTGANPFYNELKLVKKSEESLIICVYSSEGKLVYNSRIRKGTHAIPSSSWDKGLYFIRAASMSGKTESYKLIHQ